MYQMGDVVLNLQELLFVQQVKTCEAVHILPDGDAILT